jgi:hypothetical protein
MGATHETKKRNKDGEEKKELSALHALGASIKRRG